MKPYPLASLNHFTRPFAMLPYLVPFFGAAPLDAPRLYAGAPSAAEGKQKRRADWSSRGVSFGLSGFTDIRLNQNREKARSEERRVGKEGRSRWSPYR